ncbi:MAG TPA: hypothetical protein DCM87_07705 [Planctomycetes bacterium]|nr:hypothetical protein [Planctomycetota bacterium]
MKTRFLLHVALVVLTPFSAAKAGEITKYDGKGIPNVTILSHSLDEVKYKITGIRPTQKLGAWQVGTIVYTPDRILERVAHRAERSQWQSALDTLDGARRYPVMAEAMAFWRARIAYLQFAETGRGGAEAVRALESFLSEYTPLRGFYVPEALYVLGKAHLLAGDTRGARSRFTALAALTGRTRELLGGLGHAQVALAEGNARDAARRLRSVIDEAERAHVVAILPKATLWYARALVAADRAPEAIRLLRSHIEKKSAPPLFRDRLLAQANNALADAYAVSMVPAERLQALFGYLQTTCFHKQWRVECAEAFHKAEAIARTQGLEKDADGMAERLATQYGETRWARQET